MSNYSEYYLNSASNVVKLELIEISHPNFTKTYRIVRNAINGVTVTLEDASQQFFEYYPLNIVPTGNSDDLDQSLKVTLGDLGQVIPLELDAIERAVSFGIKPIMKYRTYRSDDLSAPLDGPLQFEISNLSTVKDGSVFEASAPRVNFNRTGEVYSMDRFPMLKGFL